ncbi:N-6 DNA methylase [Acidilobus sp.]|uniref:N-6 DNA methylase n=1 Tax=Acidilobus sp. TaxID=1872109 RepID=UPI003D027008
MRIDESQYKVQDLVDRKRTSSYYTSPDGVAVIRSLLSEIPDRDGVVLMDPFMGSGVLLSAVDDLVRPSKVVGIEINKEPCELGRRVLSSLYRDVEVICGDAFKVAWNYRADIILSNPPFVRWHLISDRDELLRAVASHGYGDFITRKDPGLHILFMFLIDHVLKDHGYAILVLPASAFYTEQGAGVKRLLRYRYDVLAIVENSRSPSFSSDSRFKELIVFLRKRRPFEFNPVQTAIYRYDGSLRELYRVNINRVPRLLDRNWLSLFDYENARAIADVVERALDAGLLRYLREGEIVRGIEMYGPDFFFIPNRYWSIVSEDAESVTISDGSQRLRIPRRYLVKCLRKPEHYNNSIVVSDPGFYALAIDNEPEGDVAKYVEWGLSSGTASAAVKAFGGRWYQHIWRQLQAKKPYGHIFIRDKLDTARHRILANYSREPLCATKNFYVIRDDNPLMAAWLNSNIMRYILQYFSRRISDNWTRLLEEDYMQIPVPSKVKKDVDLSSIQNAEKVIEEYLNIRNVNATII